jgi:hypothetical protein
MRQRTVGRLFVAVDALQVIDCTPLPTVPQRLPALLQKS